MAANYDAVRQAVVNSLESRGVLAKLRAELTYSVFESVDAAESDVVNPQRDALLATEDGIAALSLVQDLLTRLGLVCTSRLFEKEARLHHPMTHEQLNIRFGVNQTTENVPLILNLLSAYQSMTPSAVDGATTLATPVDCPHLSHVAKAHLHKDSDAFHPASPHEDGSATPTRIPSFAGPGTTTAELQSPAPVIPPDQASAPYPLPSDSGESMDSGTGIAKHGPDLGGQVPPASLGFEEDYLQPMDVEEAVPECVDDQKILVPGVQESIACEVPVQPAVLAPLPRNNLPPLGPIHSAGPAFPGPPRVSGEGGLGPPGPLVRNARLEGQELLDLLGSQRESEDDELPGMHEQDPDLFSDDGDVAGLELLLPDSSSESGTEPQFRV